MKKNIFILIIAFVGILAIMLLGNILIIGDKIMNIHFSLGYLYYLLLAILLIRFIIYPLIMVFKAPPTPTLNTNKLPQEKEELYKYGMLLACNSRHIANKKDRKNHTSALIHKLENGKDNHDQLKELITHEINHRMKLIDGTIREKAKSVLLITALSQNGKFDFLTSLIINVKLIHQIVDLSGFRPSYGQLYRLYFEVFLASFITDFSEDFLDEIDFSAILGSVSVPVILLKSAIDGSLSALMTMRIGYITKAYIRKGTRKITDVKQNREFRKEARHEAIKKSITTFPALAQEGLKQINGTSLKAVGGWVKNFFTGGVFTRKTT